MNPSDADTASLVDLAVADAGEVLTLQRAAYVTEAQAHHDLTIPPLTQSLAQLRAELADPDVVALGLRDGGRLVAAVRLRVFDGYAELRRLMVAPDRQRQRLGTRLLAAAERALPHNAKELRLFTGEFSLANLRLYERHGYTEVGRSNAGSHQIVHLTKPLRGG